MVLAYWELKAEETNAGAAAKGNVVLPDATETKGSAGVFAINGAAVKHEDGAIVNKAVPSDRVVIGTYIVVAIWYI